MHRLRPAKQITGIRTFYIGLILLFSPTLFAVPTIHNLPPAWIVFEPILIARLTQESSKMNLEEKQVKSFVYFLSRINVPTPKLEHLKMMLPKTTLELLMAVHSRNLALNEAENMAAYLSKIVEKFKFQNLAAFDENTSHIIGRDWQEIDYSGEGMTWQKQKLHYQPYGIIHFKSCENLKRFFPVESKLPYFNKTYKPKHPNALDAFLSTQLH